MLLIDTALANKDLAEITVRITRTHPPRTPERRAGSALYAALVTTRSTAAARTALGTFADTVTRTAALRLLDQIEPVRHGQTVTAGQTNRSVPDGS